MKCTKYKPTTKNTKHVSNVISCSTRKPVEIRKITKTVTSALYPDDEEHSKDEDEDKGFVCPC